MKSVAQTEYAAYPELYSEYVDANEGITDNNYFYVASLYRLGTAQAAQFQSGDQTGAAWHWGSKCAPTPSDATTISAVTSISCDSSATAANNVLADMPRNYDDGNNAFGDLYNWYAATAELGKFSTKGTVSDSLCPSGWKLPINSDEQTTALSWLGLLGGSYGLSNLDGLIIKKLPLSFALSGAYNLRTGVRLRNEGGRWWAATPVDTSSRALDLTPPQIYFQSFSSKATGYAVRCVLSI